MFLLAHSPFVWSCRDLRRRCAAHPGTMPRCTLSPRARATQSTAIRNMHSRRPWYCTFPQSLAGSRLVNSRLQYRRPRECRGVALRPAEDPRGFFWGLRCNCLGSYSNTLAHAKPWRIKPPHKATASGSRPHSATRWSASLGSLFNAARRRRPGPAGSLASASVSNST